MKKSKVVLAIVLAVVLLITIMNAPTFSWFTRPRSHDKSDKIVLQTKNDYTAYNANGVTFSTMSSVDGTEGSYTTNSNADHACDGSGIAYSSRRYFCTTITNSSGTDQNVSLYARTLSVPAASSNGTLAIGVNSPTRAYHDYSTHTTENYSIYDNYSKRIYFQDYNIAGWTFPHEIYVTFGYEYGTDTYKMNFIRDDWTWGRIFYVDLPYSVNWMYFTSSGWQTAGTNGGADNTMRSKQVSNMDNSMNSIYSSGVYRVINETDSNDNNYRKLNSGDVNGASIRKYYNSISLATTATFDASEGLVYQSNASVTYFSSNDEIFTVDSDGTITGVAAGTATLTTTVAGGTFGDTISEETTVTVTPNSDYVFNDVPIVKNILIPGVDDQNTTAVENQVNVYWYVINNSEVHNLSYRIDYVYVGT